MKNGNPQRLVIKPHVETHGRKCEIKNEEWKSPTSGGQNTRGDARTCV